MIRIDLHARRISGGTTGKPKESVEIYPLTTCRYAFSSGLLLNCYRSSENGAETSQFPACTPCCAPQVSGLMTKLTWQPRHGEFIIYSLLQVLFCAVKASDSIKLGSSDRCAHSKILDWPGFGGYKSIGLE